MENLIYNHFSKIHSSVEWKFKEVIAKFEQEGQQGTIDPVLFKNVYPLFTSIDIQGSSQAFNQAIRSSLLLNLSLIQKTIGYLTSKESAIFSPSQKEKINVNITALTLNHSEDIDIFQLRQFIQEEIHPSFQKLKSSSAIQQYFEMIHSEDSPIHQPITAYTESENRLNQIIEKQFLQGQKTAQEIIPHYFKKFKSDGVVFDIFVGQGILQNGQFDQELFSKLKYWQLKNLCETVRILKEEKLPLPLNTCQFILPYPIPVDIKYRNDENHFHIAGPRHIGYEILKKQLGRAEDGEDTTLINQPERIVIYCASDKIKAAYKKYINQLSEEGFEFKIIEEFPVSQSVNNFKICALSLELN